MTSEQSTSVHATRAPRVRAAARAVEILLLVAQNDEGLTARQISAELGMARQATYHLLHTLVAMGVLQRTDRGTYVLGLRIGTVTAGFERQMMPTPTLARVIRMLSQETGETCYAAGWSGGEIVTFAVARGTHAVQAAEIPQGFVGHAHARAVGKLLLAVAGRTMLDTYLDAHPLTQCTPNTITSRTTLERNLARIRSRGYAVDREELAEGLCCLAVPLENTSSPFAVAVSAPLARFNENEARYLDVARRVVVNERGWNPADVADRGNDSAA